MRDDWLMHEFYSRVRDDLDYIKQRERGVRSLQDNKAKKEELEGYLAEQFQQLELLLTLFY